MNIYQPRLETEFNMYTVCPDQSPWLISLAAGLSHRLFDPSTLAGCSSDDQRLRSFSDIIFVAKFPTVKIQRVAQTTRWQVFRFPKL